MAWHTYPRNETLVHQQLSLHQLHHPTSYLTSLCTWPGLPPLFANWVVAKAWEYGYCNSASVCLWIWVYVCDLRIQDWRDSLREGDIPPLQQWIPIDWLETLFPNIYMTVLTVNYVKCTDNSSLYKHLSCWEVMQGAMKMPNNILCGYDLGHLCGSWWSIVQLL